MTSTTQVTPNTTGRKVSVLTSGERARKDLVVRGATHDAATAAVERTFPYNLY